MYMINEKGEIDKDFIPIYDATMQKKDYIFKLIETMITINFQGKHKQKALKKWGNYFRKNQDRMQYSQFKKLGLPQGNGAVESAIRRVINLRLKSSGAFWKKENAEIYLFLRSQLISGRWNIFFNNMLKRYENTETQINIKTNSYLEWTA